MTVHRFPDRRTPTPQLPRESSSRIERVATVIAFPCFAAVAFSLW
jgi:hypothetical protein